MGALQGQAVPHPEDGMIVNIAVAAILILTGFGVSMAAVFGGRPYGYELFRAFAFFSGAGLCALGIIVLISWPT
jgi:hypothetical protein